MEQWMHRLMRVLRLRLKRDALVFTVDVLPDFAQLCFKKFIVRAAFLLHLN